MFCREFDVNQIVELVGAGDHKTLREMMFEGCSPEGIMIGGDAARLIVIAIAKSIGRSYEDKDRKMVELALDIALPWVDPWVLINYIEACVPYAHLDDKSDIKMPLDEAMRYLPTMHEQGVLDVMRYLNHNEDLLVTRRFCTLLARRVFELSSVTHTPCLFQSAKDTLLIYAGMIGDTYADDDDGSDEDNVNA